MKLKEDKPSQKNCYGQVRHQTLSHLIKIIMEVWFKDRFATKKLDWGHQILVKLIFAVLFNSKLHCLITFDNIAISMC